MVVVMQEGATEAQIQHVIDRLVGMGFTLSPTGESHTVLGAVGVRADFDTRDVELLDGVREVMRITQPYKLASREFRPAGSVVEVSKGVRVGGPEVVIMAGPCAVESAEQISTIAERVAQCGAKLLRGGAFKPRSSPYTFQGLGEQALKFMREAADRNGLGVVSEVMDPSQIQLMLPYVDLLQVGARNMQNYHLLRALGEIQKPVLLKRGLSATIEGSRSWPNKIDWPAAITTSSSANAASGLLRLPRATRWTSPPSPSSRNFLTCPSSPILRTAPAAG